MKMAKVLWGSFLVIVVFLGGFFKRYKDEKMLLNDVPSGFVLATCSQIKAPNHLCIFKE